MEKTIRNGMVAVLYSPGFGAGWYSWNTRYPQILFHPKIVEMVENGRQDDITEELVVELLGLNAEDYVCVLGAPSLAIEWLPEGSAFRINEYDGSESVQTS